MSLIAVLLVSLAGGVGAAVRLGVDGLVRARVAVAFPVSTLVVNLSGSLLLGLVTGLVSGAVLPPAYAMVLGTGLLGGYTTFSAASYETVRLLEERRYGAAVGYGLGGLVLAVAAAGIGLTVGLRV